jgi:erythritol transport system substrate-binding protein
MNRHVKNRKVLPAIAMTSVMLASSLAAGTSVATASSKLMVIITPPHDNPFFAAEATVAIAEAKKLGYRTLSLNNNNDPTTQSNEIGEAISEHAAAIILDNAGAEASIAAIKRAKSAGVPTFLIDREIDATGVAAAQIVSNNFQGAELGGAYFAKVMGEKGDYAEILGLATDTNSATRSAGFLAVLKQVPAMHLVASQAANWDQTTAYNVTQTILQAHPNITGIIALNDTMALGVVAALKAAHKTGVKIVAMDGSPQVVSLIRSGQVSGDVLQPLAVFSKLAVDEADKYIKTGKTGKPEKQLLPCYLITPANAAKVTNFHLAGTP